MSKSTELFDKFRKIAEEIAKEEGLNFVQIERIKKFDGKMGVCHGGGIIQIYIKHYDLDWVFLEENGRTLAHELAHLKHMNHGKEFWEYAAILCERVAKKLDCSIKPECVMIKGMGVMK